MGAGCDGGFHDGGDVGSGEGAQGARSCLGWVWDGEEKN